MDGPRRSRLSDRRRRGGRGNWRLHGGLGRFLFGSFGSGFGFGGALQNLANLFGHIERNGTGMGFLLRNTKAWQKINDGFCLYLQLAG